MDFQKEIKKTERQLQRLKLGKLKDGRGGNRPGAGAKKKSEPKIQCYAYIEENKVIALGGRESTQNIMKLSVDSAFKNKISTIQ